MTPIPETIESKLIMQGIHIELTEAMRTAITRKEVRSPGSVVSPVRRVSGRSMAAPGGRAASHAA